MKTILSAAKPTRWFSMPFWAMATIGLSLSVAACVGARFDKPALDNATMLSDKVPALMEKATKSYNDNEADANGVLKSLDEACDHAAATKKNKEVAEQWRLVRDDMVKPFLTRWKEKGKLDKDFIKPAAIQVRDALAAIVRAEKAKPK